MSKGTQIIFLMLILIIATMIGYWLDACSSFTTSLIRSNYIPEAFEQDVNSDDSIEYYVIHMTSNTERSKNIENQETILGRPIKRFEAIVGKDVGDDLSILDPNIINHWHHGKSELGCYLSHLLLVKQIKDSNQNGYSVIFEDDISIDKANANDYIKQIVQTLERDNRDFDIIFFGYCAANKGEEYSGEIREIRDLNKPIVIMCTHAYLINNKNAQKVYSSLLDMNDVVDHKYNTLIKQGEIKAYLISPPFINQQTTALPSTIR
jgi:GR25 family glycosyltransferase involved in LPS biosynthesis